MTVEHVEEPDDDGSYNISFCDVDNWVLEAMVKEFDDNYTLKDGTVVIPGEEFEAVPIEIQERMKFAIVTMKAILKKAKEATRE